MQSRMLTAFYTDMNQWIEEGCHPNHPTFRVVDGLCFNLTNWVKDMAHWTSQGAMQAVHDKLMNEMTNQFAKSTPSTRFPFNQGSAQQYADEYKDKYQNKARTWWVFCHARNRANA